MEEIAAFLIVAEKYDLDPFTNEIYAFPSSKGGIIPIIGVDGFISKMTKHPAYDGMEMEWATETVKMEGAKECPIWCEISIFRRGSEKPTTIREYLDEVYCPPKSGYPGPWQTHTKRMLRHKTICQGVRAAFGVTGIYDEDEAMRIIDTEIVDVDPIKPPKAIAQKDKTPTTDKQEQPAGKKKDSKPTVMEMKIHEFKKALNQITGNDDEYYTICGGMGYEHVTEMDAETQSKFATQLAKKIKGLQEK
jgi:phage recombination protein Bet